MEGRNSSATNPAPIDEDSSNSSSLTLSLTPPLSDNPKNDTSTISEHLSSIENDRSIGENFMLVLENFPPEEHISQEPKPPSLNSSFSSSFVSLNGLERFIGTNMEGRVQAQSILEEILSNEQFKLEPEESFDFFANVNLDDKLLDSYNCPKSANFNLSEVRNDSVNNSYDEVCKRIKDFEELIAVKDTTIAALTSELDSFREMISNSSSLGTTTTTEYKQFQEECHSKLMEYHAAILHKDEQIEKLTNSLQQSILNREEMKQHFKNEIAQLQEQLAKTSSLLKEHKCVIQKPEFAFDECCSNFEAVLGPEQINLFKELKVYFNNHVESNKRGLENEIRNLEIKLKTVKMEYETEILRLQQLLSKDKLDLDAKHSKELEELRLYFEKKCTDLEKNYSEEVYSHQSRKLSDATSGSDAELYSDFVFNQPGPGGDTQLNYTKKDLTKLRQTLAQMMLLLDNANLDQLSDEDFENLKTEMAKFELKNLLKYDLTLIKTELQNKYHAELEILREDYDNRVDSLNLEHEKKLEDVERRYLAEIDNLNVQLRGRIVSTAQQEVANSGEFEIDEVVQSYERRLQEQVTLAKIDIIAALESQIQRLVASDSLDEPWPEELLQLKSRFAEKYQHEIDLLNEQHSTEIARLKEEHSKNLNAALERARRRSLRDADSLSKGELELLKERDLLKKQTLALRNLVGELIKYFTQCEDELNNTLVEELITKNFSQIEKELESPRDSIGGVKRVHIAPNFNDLINLIDNSPDNDLESIDLKTELGTCLAKLKEDASAILALSSTFSKSGENGFEIKPRNGSLEKELTSLTRKLINETQIKNELVEKLNESKSIIQSLETERETLEKQFEALLERHKVLEGDLSTARDKIAELIENGHKEIVSEGYGEDGVKGLADAVAALNVLQEKARTLAENPEGVESNVVHLIEDFARVGDQIVEEGRKDREDLKKQIEAADKKYKITCQFLEDQAAEREQERDDAQREIDALKDHLREREKDRANCERITNEVEQLEQQLRDMSKLLDVTEKRCKEVEAERQEAVDKIYELRDIIRDLEEQVKSKITSEEELKSIVSELEVIAKSQANEAVNKRKDVSDVRDFHQYVGDLESEVQKLRLNSEIAGSEGALKQIKNHLCDFESTLDKRTKDLEGLHSGVSNTTCSSPSEDMSIRDVVHQDKSIYDECEVPLQQLARLKEKLLRHSRAEDAAVKRIRDLEMQIMALKSELEESQNEREILNKQISDHLVLISNLQIRLDEQRIRAEHIEKQTNTSLEVQNYDLKTTVFSLQEKIAKRDKLISQLKNTIDETKKRLENREKELAENKEDQLVIQMQEQIEYLRSENMKMKSKDHKGICNPETERKLEMFNSLNLDDKDLETLKHLRLSGVSFNELFDLENVEQCRKVVRDDTIPISPIAPPGGKADKTVYETLSDFHSLPPRANSTEKHVRFEDEVGLSKVNELEKQLMELNEAKKLEVHKFEKQLAERDERDKLKVSEFEKQLTELNEANKLKVHDLERQLTEKDEVIRGYNERLHHLELLQDQLQVTLEETEASLKSVTERFEEESRKNEEEVQRLHTDLQARFQELERCQKELEEERKRVQLRDKELKTLYKVNNELKNHLKTKEIELNGHEEALKIQNEELQRLQDEVMVLQQQTGSKDQIIEKKTNEIEQLTRNEEDASKELLHLQHLLSEKEKVIEQMEADSRSLHINLETIQNKLQETGNIVDLGRRLREEQKKNSELHEELHVLKAQLLTTDNPAENIEHVTDQLEKELNYSSYLDTSLINAFDSLENGNADVDLRKHKSIIKQLVKNREATEKKFDDLLTKYEALKKELERVQYEDAILIGQLRTKLNQTLDNKVLYDEKLKMGQAEKVELKEKLKTMKRTVNNLNSKASSLPDMKVCYVVKGLEDEITGLRKEIKQLSDNKKIELALKDDKIMDLEAQVVRCGHGETIMKGRLETLKADFDAKMNELVKNKALLEQTNAEVIKLRRLLEQKPKSSDTVPQKLMEKIVELNTVVKEDQQKMTDVVARLTNENAFLKDRIVVLEEHKNYLPFDDPTSRANYLFRKYLRSESYRKALAWQKRYLMTFFEPDFVHLKGKRQEKRYRFKHVAVMVLSICRMKFIVRRWHTGKRIVPSKSVTTIQFQVGQPVSSQNFAPKESKSALNQPKTDMSWLGTSPPTKDKFHSKREGRLEPPVFQRSEEVESASSASRNILQSPTLVTRYTERFNQIQERLGFDNIIQ